MKLDWHDGASEEFVEAAGYYALVDASLGERFIAQVEAAVGRAQQAPAAFRKLAGGVRTIHVDRFPYVVIFHPEAEAIRIVAVMRMHREPGYWRDGLE